MTIFHKTLRFCDSATHKIYRTQVPHSNLFFTLNSLFSAIMYTPDSLYEKKLVLSELVHHNFELLAQPH